MKRKMLLLFVVLMLLLSFVGCGTKAAPETTAAPAGTTAAPETTAKPAWVFERPVEIIVPWGPGSGTDTTIRAFQPALEKALGVSLVINNVAGAGGVAGAEFLANQPTDGYTFGLFTPSHTIAAINKTTTFDILNETIPVSRLVYDSNVLLAGNHVPYNTITEMVAYCKANPDYVPTVAMMSIVGLDGVSTQQLFDAIGVKATFIPYASGAEANAAVMGGHTDMVVTSPFDGLTYVESGDMKGLILLAEKRGSTMPDVECTGELGINAYIGPWRGVVAKKGTPQEAIDAFEAAIVKANEDADWLAWKKSVGLLDRPGFANQAEFKEIWMTYYDTMNKLLVK